MRKIRFVTLFTLAMALSCIVGYSTMVYAYGNVTDTQYMYHNAGAATMNTSGRAKLDATKVYIHPTSGPELKYTVQGYDNSHTPSTWENRSSTHQVSTGVKASFTNFVYENGNPTARLHMEKTQSVSIYTVGVWSPDSTRNYTIYK